MHARQTLYQTELPRDVFCCCCCFVLNIWFTKTESPSVAQAPLEFSTLLPRPSKYWDFGYGPQAGEIFYQERWELVRRLYPQHSRNKALETGFQDQLQLKCKSEASLGFMRPCLKIKENKQSIGCTGSHLCSQHLRDKGWWMSSKPALAT